MWQAQVSHGTLNPTILCSSNFGQEVFFNICRLPRGSVELSGLTPPANRIELALIAGRQVDFGVVYLRLVGYRFRVRHVLVYRTPQMSLTI